MNPWPQSNISAGQEFLARSLRLMLDDQQELEVRLEAVLRELLGLSWLGLQPRGAVFLRNKEVLHLAAQVGLETSLQEKCAKVPVESCLCGQVALHGEPLFRENSNEVSRYTYSGSPQSHYVLPLRSKEEMLGVLKLYCTAEHHREAATEALLQNTADLMALGIARKQERTQLENFRRVVEQVADGVFITNTKGVIEYVNPAFEQLAGYTAAEMLGQTPRLFKSGKYSPEFYRQLWESLLAGTPVRETLINRKKNGELYYENKVITPLRDERGQITHFVSSGRDVTQERMTQERLEFLASRDPLTSLLNRHAFKEHVTRSLHWAKQQGRLLALAYLDLGDFKKVNDTLGHSVGDRLLAAVAGRLNSILRSREILARLGGDEFGVLFEIASREEAVQAIQRLSEELTALFKIEEREVYVEVDIGVALFPEHGETFEGLLQQAELAMYQAKRESTDGYVFFSQALDTPLPEHLALGAEVRSALEKDGLTLHYQPILNLRNHRVAAAEALLRWPHPRLGLLSPATLFNLTEQVGLAVAIDRFVAHKGLFLLEHGGPEQLWINLTAHSLNNRSFPEFMSQALQQSGVPPQRLVLEITEAAAVRDTEQTSQAMERLSQLGLRLAIDDFGTGYSSLFYLHQLPVSFLKIDRRFVAEIGKNARTERLLETIIRLAHDLGLEVVGEGVETEQQLAWLKDAKADYAQGYHIGRPEPWPS